MLYILNVVKENSIYKLKNIINQSTGEILSLIDFLCLDGIVYVNNLDFAFMEICKKLIELKYKNVFKAQKNNQFSFVYKNGECLQIKIIKANKKHLTIVNFETKFLQPFTTYENNIALVNYAIKKNRVSASLGVDAFNEFLLQAFKSHGQQVKNIHACKEIFRRRDYPIIDNEILNQAKENTSGYQMALQGLYTNIFFVNFELPNVVPTPNNVLIKECLFPALPPYVTQPSSTRITEMRLTKWSNPINKEQST